MESQSIQDQNTRTWSEWLAWVATEDHCEWANRFVYWVKTPLGILGLAAAAALACGLWVAPQGYAVLAAIAVVVAIGLAWPWVGVRGLRCELSLISPRGRAGKPCGIDVSITNRWPWPVWGLAIEDGFSGDDRPEAAVALARIGGWSKTTFRWDFTPELRGVYPKRAPSIVTEFPFGLWKARREIVVGERLTAWPDSFWLPPYPRVAGRRDWSGLACDAQSGDEGERIGVREHRPGDTLRMVHWSKSATLDRLVVSEREGFQQGFARLTVDVDPASHAGEGGSGSREWAIRIAASVCETFLAQGIGVEVCLEGADSVCRAQRRDLPALMDWLATFDSDTATPPPRRPAFGGRPLEVRIGTEASRETGGTAILLRRDAFDRTVSSRDDRRAWIVVETSEEIPGQILRGWRSTAGETARAS